MYFFSFSSFHSFLLCNNHSVTPTTSVSLLPTLALLSHLGYDYDDSMLILSPHTPTHLVTCSAPLTRSQIENGEEKPDYCTENLKNSYIQIKH